jgi:hypothetical protein
VKEKVENQVKQDADSLAAQKKETEHKAKEEAERLAKAKAETERKAKQEATRLAAEKAKYEQFNADRNNVIKASTLLMEGKKLLENKDWTKAAEVFRQVLSLTPNHAETEKLLADAEAQISQKSDTFERTAKEEAARLAAQKAETERIAGQKAEDERLAKAKAETERKAKEEAVRLVAQKAEADRLAEEKPAGQPTGKKSMTKGVVIGVVVGVVLCIIVIFGVISWAGNSVAPINTPPENTAIARSTATAKPIAQATKTNTTIPSSTPRPTQTNIPPTPTPAPIGVPVIYNSLEITVLGVITHTQIVPGGAYYYYSESGKIFIDVGVRVRNLKPGNPFKVQWSYVYIDEGGGSWYPLYGDVKQVDSDPKLDPFNIGIKTEVKGTDIVAFDNDTYLRLIFYVTDDPTQIILFRIEDSSPIQFQIKK